MHSNIKAILIINQFTNKESSEGNFVDILVCIFFFIIYMTNPPPPQKKKNTSSLKSLQTQFCLAFTQIPLYVHTLMPAYNIPAISAARVVAAIVC